MSGGAALDGLLPVATVQRIERLVGGDPVTEGQILRFIGARYRAKNLFYLPPHVAAQVCKRPTDFIRAAKEHQRNAKRGIAAKKRKEPKGFNHR